MDARTRAGLERAMTALSSDLAGHFEDQRPESAGPPVQLGPGPDLAVIKPPRYPSENELVGIDVVDRNLRRGASTADGRSVSTAIGGSCGSSSRS